ncbi:lipoprotein [Rhodopirellula maiorica SM1]|uniref:Lipoprotein n=1 Tax=Rhodopirellula maiorica SM1 TaxID=1265738 RepID=M5RMN9_9BACT|nr:hypothetical protein [Rhodopirellula maiorica]EMI20461.1 lipoprotein [Rhodopirellula maiorica SM1]
MSWRKPWVFLAHAFSGIAILIASGCSEPEPERIAIHGTIQAEGKPIEHATLILTPVSESAAPVTTRIEAGRFAFTRHTGPYAGEYIVRVNPDEASIEAIIEVAEQDPRQAARKFGAPRSPTSLRKSTAETTKRIEITPQCESPLQIDL